MNDGLEEVTKQKLLDGTADQHDRDLYLIITNEKIKTVDEIESIVDNRIADYCNSSVFKKVWIWLIWTIVGLVAIIASILGVDLPSKGE